MYTVDISPSAWNQLAHLKVDTYRRIREELDAVAVALSQSHGLEVSSRWEARVPSRSPVVVGETIAHYDVDHALRRVRLLEVERRLAQEL